MWQLTKNIIFYTLSGLVTLLGLLVILGYVFEKEVVQHISEELNATLNRKVDVSTVEFSMVQQFPNASLILNDVFVPDGRDTLVSCERVFLNFSPLDLISGNFTIHQLTFKKGITKIRDGAKPNYLLLKKQPESTSSENSNLVLESVKMKDMEVDYWNGESYHFSIASASISGIWAGTEKALSGIIQLEGATIGKETLPFPFEVDGNYHFSKEEASANLQWMDSEVDVLYHQKGTERQLKFSHIKTTLHNAKHIPWIPLSFSDSLLDPNHVYTGTGELTLNTKGVDNLQFDLHFQEQKLELDLGSIRTSGSIALNGSSSSVNLELFANTWLPEQKAEPIAAHLTWKNIPDGPLLFDLQGPAGFQTSGLQITSEHIQIQGKIQEPLKLLGLSLTQGKIEQLQARFNRVQIEMAEVQIKNNNIATSLFTTQLDGETISGEAQVDLTPDMGIQWFSAHLKSSFFTALKWSDAFQTENSESSEEMAFKGSITLDADAIAVDNFEVNDVTLKGKLSNKGINLEHYSLGIFDGKSEGKAAFLERKSGWEFACSGTTEKIDLPSLFQSFKNFNQEVILHHQIKGKASSEFTVHFSTDRNLIIRPISVFADLKLRIAGGELNGVPLLADLGETLAKNPILNKALDVDKISPALNAIQLGTLENHITLSAGKLNIPKMLVRSNALKLHISGQHTLDNKLNYKFDFRLQDVLVRKKEDEFGYYPDQAEGTQLFFKLIGTPDAPQFKYDREAAQAHRKEQKKAERENIKTILKREFGGDKGKSDETAGGGLIFEIDSVQDVETPQEEEKSKKREGKISKFLKKITAPDTSQQPKEQLPFEVEDDDF